MQGNVRARLNVSICKIQHDVFLAALEGRLAQVGAGGAAECVALVAVAAGRPRFLRPHPLPLISEGLELDLEHREPLRVSIESWYSKSLLDAV